MDRAPSDLNSVWLPIDVWLQARSVAAQDKSVVFRHSVDIHDKHLHQKSTSCKIPERYGKKCSLTIECLISVYI